MSPSAVADTPLTRSMTDAEKPVLDKLQDALTRSLNEYKAEIASFLEGDERERAIEIASDHFEMLANASKEELFKEIIAEVVIKIPVSITLGKIEACNEALVDSLLTQETIRQLQRRVFGNKSGNMLDGLQVIIDRE